MVKACWEGYGAGDVCRGIRLVTRSSFWTTSVQKILSA